MEIPKNLTMIDVSVPIGADIAQKTQEKSNSLSIPDPASSTTAVPVISASLVSAVITIANSAWRIRSKVEDSMGETKEDISKDDLKKVKRYVDTLFHSLSGIGMEIRDRTGEAFDYGLPERVVTTQPQPGINKEQILETLRPTIYWSNQIVQQGEVVIATPEARAK